MDILSYILGKKAGGGGGEAVLVNKNISANGTYNASSDSADGYKKVVVNVANSYAAGDEGKVVSNGALVAQGSDTVTANDTYDTTLISELTVNVSGGGSSDQTGSFTPAENSNMLTLTFSSEISYLIVWVDPSQFSDIMADTSGKRRMVGYSRTPNGVYKCATPPTGATLASSSSAGPLSPISSINENQWPSSNGSGYFMGGYTYYWKAW